MKKLLCLLVVLCVVLTLPACGRKPVPSAGEPHTTTSGTNFTEGTQPKQETTASTEDTQSTEQPATEATVPPETRPAPQQQTQPTMPPETQPAQPQPTEPPIPPQVETPVPTYGHTPLARTEYYQYTLMTAEERQLYDKLVAAIENLQSEVAVTGMTIQADAGITLFHRVLADNPQLFWVSRTASVTYDPRTQNVRSFILLYTDGEKADTMNSNTGPVAVADRAKITAKRKALEDKIAQILATIPANYPEVEREKRIHDYILTHLQYDYAAAANPTPANSVLPHAYDIYGAAVEGKSVCEGYAKLFQYLCYRTGINATQISGTADGGGHMWNAVKIDGDWYEIDVTWDDGDGELLYYQYFNLTHSQMAQNHSTDGSEIPFPQCNGTKYRYADYYALKAISATQVSDNYKLVIDRLIEANGGDLILYRNGIAMNADSYNALVYSNTAAINQYARQRGYKLTFASTYTVYEDFSYIPCTVEKL